MKYLRLVTATFGVGAACTPTASARHDASAVPLPELVEAKRPTPPDDPDDVIAYAELCKHELGITGPLPAMSCVAGEEIPITVDGRRLDAPLYERLKEGAGCDRPQWLGGDCHTYALVQRVDVSADVDAILICRQKYWSSPAGKAARAEQARRARGDDRLDAFRLYAEFNDLGFILRHRGTGKTCFFTIFGRQFFGGWVPPPDLQTLPPEEDVLAAIGDPSPPPAYPTSAWYRGARATYLTPRKTAAGDCVRCHDLGAFKHSPFIDQLDLVPSNGAAPYLVVGDVFQASFREAGLLEVTTEPIDGEPQKCTTCHRMTSGGQTCRSFLEWSTGHYPYAVSTSARRFPAAAWMPPDLDARIDSAGRFSRAWGAHVARMQCCCEKPTARGCLSRPFGPTTDSLPGGGIGDFTPAAQDAPDSCL